MVDVQTEVVDDVPSLVVGDVTSVMVVDDHVPLVVAVEEN